MTTPVESVVLCEGFHDRAFWAGWLLERLRWTDARPRPAGVPYGDAVDPFGKKVTRGQFAYLAPSGAFLRVWPCHGDDKVFAAMTRRLRERTTNGLRRLVVNLDTDAQDGDPAATAVREKGLLVAVESHVRAADRGFTRTDDGDFSLDGGATLVSLVLWSADDAPTPELPSKKTLERLVCAALRVAYPERAANVDAWLRSRHSPPGSTAGGAKEHAWSHMAGWYASHNCDDFYHAVWRDEKVAPELEVRLRASGALRVADALAV